MKEGKYQLALAVENWTAKKNQEKYKRMSNDKNIGITTISNTQEEEIRYKVNKTRGCK